MAYLTYPQARMSISFDFEAVSPYKGVLPCDLLLCDRPDPRITELVTLKVKMLELLGNLALRRGSITVGITRCAVGTSGVEGVGIGVSVKFCDSEVSSTDFSDL